LIPTLEGSPVETIGDDIRLDEVGEDGRLYAINPRPASSAWLRARRAANPKRDAHDRAQLDLHQLAR